jgi:shikimate kinase
MARKDREDNLTPLKNVYLTGFMCAGKTTAGRALARRLGRPFRDSDGLIEKTAGKTLAALVREKGLPRFRAIEAALVRTLTASGGQVIALGGGVYLSRKWKKLLQAAGTTVFLHCPWPELEKRLKKARGPRPLLAGPWREAGARAAELYGARLPFYSLADIQVSTAGVKPERTAQLIKKLLAGGKYL